jgi:hypothetical protein
MSDTNDDPVLAHLRERRAALQEMISGALARLDEINSLLTTLGDGRTRVRKRIKENPADRQTYPAADVPFPIDKAATGEAG